MSDLSKAREGILRQIQQRRDGLWRVGFGNFFAELRSFVSRDTICIFSIAIVLLGGALAMSVEDSEAAEL